MPTHPANSSQSRRPPTLASVLGGCILDLHLESRLDRPAADVASAVATHGDVPQPEFAGLTANQTADLMAGDWSTVGTLRLRSDLALRDLEGAPFLHDARTILLHVAGNEPVKATKAGCLSRASVRALLPALRIRDERRDADRRTVVIEYDLMWLELARILLIGTELIVREGGHFRITDAGLANVEDDRAGVLFTALFIVLFRSYPLFRLDRGLEVETGLQLTIPCTFYLLGKRATTWKTAEVLAAETWMPGVRDQMAAPAVGAGRFDRSRFAFAARVLAPLMMFGLMEKRMVGTQPNRRSEYRVTPLYHRFMRFEWPTPARSSVRLPLGVQ